MNTREGPTGKCYPGKKLSTELFLSWAVNIYWCISFLMLNKYIVYMNSVFKTQSWSSAWIYALAFRIPYIQTLKKANQNRWWTVRECIQHGRYFFFRISPVEKFHHALERAFMIQRVILILSNMAPQIRINY